MTPTTDSTTNLSKTIVFYQKANFLLRIATISALLWPVFAIATAILLKPSNAQTVVPLVTLSPFLPMVLFLLGAPFQYFLIAQDPDAKIGFRWAIALIAVELSIGVYFAVIPVSNDPGLTPLLILIASALFFLKLAQIARWLQILFVILLMLITTIFVAGGRERIQAALNSPNRVPIIRVPPQAPPSVQYFPVQTNSPQTNTAQTAPGTPPLPAPGATATGFFDSSVCADLNNKEIMEYSDVTRPQAGGDIPLQIDVTGYKEDCFGKVVRLPDWFKTGWCYKPIPEGNPGSDWSISFQFVKMDPNGNPIHLEKEKGPYHWSTPLRPEDRPFFDGFPLTFRLKGKHVPKGGIAFYAASSDGTCGE